MKEHNIGIVEDNNKENLNSTKDRSDKKPLVPVIMPMFNHKKYVGAAIESLLAQRYKNWQLVIIDDGSTDGSLDVVESYLKQDKRIEYYYQDNQGEAMARNAGLHHARGKYVAWQDADDTVHPERLSELVNCLNERKDVGGVASFYQGVNDRDDKILYKIDWRYPKDRTRDSLDIIYNYILAGTMMVRKELLQQLRGFRRLAIATDKDMLLRLEEKTNIYVVERFLYNHRQHRDSSLHRVSGKAQPRKKSRRLEITLGNLAYLLSAYTRRIYGRDPLATVPLNEPLARARHLLPFIFYPKIYRFVPRILRLNKMSLPELLVRFLWDKVTLLFQTKKEQRLTHSRPSLT